MKLTTALAKRHLDTYHVGYDERQLRTLETLLADVYFAGRGSTHDEHWAGPHAPVDASQACKTFSALSLTELRCARCHQPAWVHQQPISMSTALSPVAVDGAGCDRR